MHTRPVWVEISRRHLLANYLELRSVLGQQLAPFAEPGSESNLLAVVKANAYGHGLEICAPALVAAGADWIGVTSVEEGVFARRLCPDAAILIMSGLWQGEADAVVAHRLTPVVWEDFHLDLLEKAALRIGLRPGSLPVHVEVDTGMARQGVPSDPATLASFFRRFDRSSALLLEGVSTHFSSPEVLDGKETGLQLKRFAETLSLISSAGHRPRWIHAGNSATLLDVGQLSSLHGVAATVGARLMVRPGLALYGYAPRFQAGEPGNTSLPDRAMSLTARLKPVLSWKTRVVSLRAIQAGEPVGYNTTYRAARPTRLALLPTGYADGLNRLLSNRGSVLVRGRRAPIAGRISMDQTVVDVTDIENVSIGDEAVIIGAQASADCSAWALADLCGTIPYEVLCAIGGRVPRVAVD